MFGSRRNAQPTPTPPPFDPDATEVNTEWLSTIHRHLNAQRPTPFSPPPALPPAPVTDGFRHGSGPIPPAPQRPFQPSIPSQSEQTAYLPSPANQYQDPTDVGAQLHAAELRNQNPQQGRRVLEYYGNPQIKNILVVVGIQVHGSSSYGVEITPNGPNLDREIVPWHRVHSLKAAPGDPILHPTY